MLLYVLIHAEWYLYFGIIIGCLVCESFSVVTLPFLRESFSLQMTEQEWHHSRGSFLGYFWRGSDFWQTVHSVDCGSVTCSGFWNFGKVSQCKVRGVEETFLDKSHLTLLTKARKPGNQQQFNHSVKVLEKSEVTLMMLLMLVRWKKQRKLWRKIQACPQFKYEDLRMLLEIFESGFYFCTFNHESS